MVSRETSISAGLAELDVQPHGPLKEAVAKLAKLWQLLETRAVPLGFLGPAEVERIGPRHILESAALTAWLPTSGRLIDIGSGAGLPGLVLACLRVDQTVLIESKARRAVFLREAAHELELEVQIENARAEDAARGPLRESAVAATARALAVPIRALELTLPFVAVGGVLLLPITPGARPDDAPLAATADVLGGSTPEVHGFEVPGVDARRWVMIVRKLRETPGRFPRSAGAMRRRSPS